MIGILVQLAISWLLIWLIEKKQLSVLGFMPSGKRVTDFSIFFLITAICCASGYVMRMAFGEKWEINPSLSAGLIAEGVWWNIKSVLFEELIFRGAIFYILIKRIGTAKAIILSSIAFGIYHWFSFGILGNVSQMIIVFFITGTMGLVLAYGFAKSSSLFIPIAIHLGWNATRSVIFSDMLIGDQLLVQVKPVPQVQVSYFTYYFITVFPLVSALLINFLLLKKKKQVPLP